MALTPLRVWKVNSSSPDSQLCLGIGLALVCVVLFLAYTASPPLGPLLAVFAIMPAYSIISHWSDNEQRGHLFGYWFWA